MHDVSYQNNPENPLYLIVKIYRNIAKNDFWRYIDLNMKLRYKVKMELFTGKRITYLLLAVCIAFTVISAETIITDDHDCIGKNCIFCQHIYAYKNIIKVTTCLFIDSIQLSQLNEQKTKETISSFFLIEQKVRLNT